MRSKPSRITKKQQHKRYAMIDKLHRMWLDAFEMQGRFDHNDMMYDHIGSFLSALEAAQDAHDKLYRCNWDD